jgi:hypothetical protein
MSSLEGELNSLRRSSPNKCIPGLNDLATHSPSIAEEADGWEPTNVARGSSKQMSWRCSRGHTWRASVVSRTGGGQGCPFCAGVRVWKGFNDLQTTHPELARQLVTTDPTTISKGTSRKLQWRCDEHGHVYTATVSHRREGKGCPFCSGNQILEGFNDFATTHPQLAREAMDDPKSFSKGTNRRIKWVCSSGHQYAMYPSNRIKGDQCPVCKGRKIIEGFNDLATTHPAIAREAHGWDPTAIGRGHARKLEWQCPNGHRWRVSPNQRTSTSSGCPYCSGQRAIEGENDLATTHPHLLAEVEGWNPRAIKAGSKVKRSWRCAQGHIYQMSPHLRTYQGSGCPFCSNNRVLAGFNDLATRNPEIAVEALGWDPSAIHAQSGSRRKFQCGQGHVWTARISDRTAHGSGCPSCAKTGFDPNEPGFLYLLRDDLRDLFQIGITNSPQSRLATHERNGWEVVDVRGPMDGQTARDLETSLLRELRTRGAVFANKQRSQKFDGWSESWVQGSYRVSLLSELLSVLY